MAALRGRLASLPATDQRLPESTTVTPFPNSIALINDLAAQIRFSSNGDQLDPNAEPDGVLDLIGIFANKSASTVIVFLDRGYELEATPLESGIVINPDGTLNSKCMKQRWKFDFVVKQNPVGVGVSNAILGLLGKIGGVTAPKASSRIILESKTATFGFCCECKDGKLPVVITNSIKFDPIPY